MTSQLIRRTGIWVVVLAITLVVILGLFAAEAPEAYGQTCGNDIPFNQWNFGETTSYSRVREYYFYGDAGSRVSIQMERDDVSDIDPYLELIDPFGNIVAADDDGAGSGNSRINYRLRRSGCYSIIARSYQNSTFGAFWLYAAWY